MTLQNYQAPELRQQSEAPNQTATRFSVIDGGGVKRSGMPSIIASHFCSCQPGATCVCCLSWNRTIRSIEQRMAQVGV